VSGIIKAKDWPECLKGHPKLRGIYVGGCVERGQGSSFRAKAHAHFKGQSFGWICIRKASRINDTDLMIHELAHILTEQGHTPTWRARVVELGGTLQPTESLRSYEGATK